MVFVHELINPLNLILAFGGLLWFDSEIVVKFLGWVDEIFILYMVDIIAFQAADLVI